MDGAFFSAHTLQAIHNIVCDAIEKGIPPSSKALAVFVPSDISLHEAVEMVQHSNQTNNYRQALQYSWYLFCLEPQNPHYLKTVCDSLFRYWKKTPFREDWIALTILCRLLCTLTPEDRESQNFQQLLTRLNHKENRWLPWFFVFGCIVGLFFVYHQTNREITLPPDPTISVEIPSVQIPPVWDEPSESGILLVDQGSRVIFHEEGLLSYLLLIQIRNRGETSLQFIEGTINIYDRSDTVLCSEPIILLSEDMGPLQPEDDGYKSLEIQCNNPSSSQANRVLIHVERKETIPYEEQEESYVSSFPALPLRITKRQSQLTELDNGGYWLHEQLVVYNEDKEAKSHILIRIHYYDANDRFLAIEERTVLEPNTNSLAPKKHILHSVGMPIAQIPHRMNVELVEVE